jgi:hypothetical protein
MAASGDFQWPPMGRFPWPPSVVIDAVAQFDLTAFRAGYGLTGTAGRRTIRR